MLKLTASIHVHVHVQEVADTVYYLYYSVHVPRRIPVSLKMIISSMFFQHTLMGLFQSDYRQFCLRSLEKDYNI